MIKMIVAWVTVWELKDEFGEFIGFVGSIGFVEFVGFMGFVEFVESIGFVGFVGFVGFIGLSGVLQIGNESGDLFCDSFYLFVDFVKLLLRDVLLIQSCVQLALYFCSRALRNKQILDEFLV